LNERLLEFQKEAKKYGIKTGNILHIIFNPKSNLALKRMKDYNEFLEFRSNEIFTMLKDCGIFAGIIFTQLWSYKCQICGKEERKSISAERTFFEDTDDFNSIFSKLGDINEKIHRSVIKHHIAYKTISLKIRFEGYQTYTRSKTLPFHIQDKDRVMEVILELFREFSNNMKKVRLVGIRLSNLERNHKVRQTDLLNYAYAP